MKESDRRDGVWDSLQEEMAQLGGYLSGLGLDTGRLVIFDRRSGVPPIGECTECTTSPLNRNCTTA